MCAALLIGVQPFDRKKLIPYLQHKYFSISGPKTLWSANRCGVFSKVTLSSALLLELASLEEDWVAARCRTAAESCQPRRGGHGRQGCSSRARPWGTGSIGSNNPASHKNLRKVASIYNTTVAAGTGSRRVPAGTVRDSLCWTASTLPVPAEGCDRGIRKQACRWWLPASSGGLAWSPRRMLSSPLCQPLALGKSLHRPRALCSSGTFWLQVPSPCVTGPQTI